MPHALRSRDDPAEFTRITQSVLASDGQLRRHLETITNVGFSGPYMKFLLTAPQGADGGRLYAELSAELLARPA